MTNPIGLKLIKSFVAAPFNSTTVEFIVPASDTIELFLNDPVKTTNQTDDTGIDFCSKANPGDFLRGFVVGLAADHDKENDLYRKTATRRKVRVCQDPFLIARAQVDAAIATTDIGRFIDMDSGTGNVNTGISEVALDYTTINDTSGQFYILQIEEIDEDNDTSIVLCSIAKHELLRGIAGTEDFWDRSGTNLIPHFTGDSVNLGTGNITAADAYFTGKLTVDGLIDPTGLGLTPQATPPSTADGISYYDSVSKTFQFRENGVWHSLGETSLWQRNGTALAPFNTGDSVNGGLLTTQTLPLRNNVIDDLGVDINADGSLTVNAPGYEALVTDDDDIPNRKFVIDAILELSHTQYEPFTATAAQTTFTILGPTPINPTAGQIVVQGVVFEYGVSNDFTISGNTITWYNNNYTMQNNDAVQIWYDGPGSAAPEWGSYSGTLPVAGGNLYITAAQLGLSDARQIVEAKLWGRGTDKNWYFAGNTWGGATRDFNFTIPTLDDPNVGKLAIQLAGTATAVAGQPFKISFWHQNTNFLT